MSRDDKFRLDGGHCGCSEPWCNACKDCDGCKGCCTCAPDAGSRIARGRLHEFYDALDRWQVEQDALENSHEALRRHLTELLDALARKQDVVDADQSADGQRLRDTMSDAKQELKRRVRSQWY